MRIIISRSDAIGDVMLTLPMLGFLKQEISDCHITFIGRAYTKAIINMCEYVDSFINADELLTASPEEAVSSLQNEKADCIIHVFPQKQIARLALKAKIPIRIGTSHRLFHWFTCNKLIALGRKNSDSHESELNMRLIKPIIKSIPDKALWNYVSLAQPNIDSSFLKTLLDEKKVNLIIHPKSKGSAREWPAKYYQELIQELNQAGFNIILTGTHAEGELFMSQINHTPNDVKISFGKLSLQQLLLLIAHADGLLACSTGPLHIAAAYGKLAMGIYPPIRPMHPGRWAPIGKKVKIFCLKKTCNLCRTNLNCTCISDIHPNEIKSYILNQFMQIDEQ